MAKQSCKKQHKHHEKKQQQTNTSSIKIMRPKVYITDSSKFKNLVQQLTGNVNGNGNSPMISSSPPPTIPISPPAAPYLECSDYGYQDNGLDLSFDSSCFCTPVNGSPDLQVVESLNYYEMGNSVPVENVDFAIQYKELEALLMGLNPVSYDHPVCGIVNDQQEVCSVYDYDYDLPCFV